MPKFMYETRKRFIHDLVEQRGSVTVAELKELLTVSDMTIRRAIRSMAAEGLLRQVHGGAVCRDCVGGERSFSARRVEELPRKQAIARLAYTCLNGGESLFIDGSTTCSELALLLKGGGKRTVVTSSLSVLVQLAGSPEIELVLAGGVLDRDGNTFDGLLAVENARRIHVDFCFFSAAGFSEEDITNGGMIGSQVKQIMIGNARRRVLLADSTKYGKHGILKLCRWEDVDTLISDDGLAARAREAISSAGPKVLIADLPGA